MFRVNGLKFDTSIAVGTWALYAHVQHSHWHWMEHSHCPCHLSIMLFVMWVDDKVQIQVISLRTFPSLLYWLCDNAMKNLRLMSIQPTLQIRFMYKSLNRSFSNKIILPYMSIHVSFEEQWSNISFLFEMGYCMRFY